LASGETSRDFDSPWKDTLDLFLKQVKLVAIHGAIKKTQTQKLIQRLEDELEHHISRSIGTDDRRHCRTQMVGRRAGHFLKQPTFAGRRPSWK
jgi:hypothetical protein